MSKQCERPGCSGPAEVLYGFDPIQLLVWLEKGPMPVGSRANALCRRHADALAVPKGWYIDDRREAAPRLFRAPAKAKVVNIAPARGKKSRNPPAPKPESFDDVEVSIVADEPSRRHPAATNLVETELAETKAIAWTPQFDSKDDLGGVLRPRGRLMSRAFGLDDTKTNLRIVRSAAVDSGNGGAEIDGAELEREPFNENDIP